MIQYKKDNVTVFQSVLYMTTSAIIEMDHSIIVTDPNWLPNEVESIKNYIEQIRGKRQLYIIYTHSDFDHIIGAGALRDAKVIATDKFANNSNKNDTIQKIHKFDQGYYLQRNYEPEYPDVDIVVVDDGQTVDLGADVLTFYKAPGHTEDSLFTVIEPYGIFLSGDYLSDVEFPFIFSSYTDYIETIKKAEKILSNHEVKIHIPGHGTTTEDQEEMKERLSFSMYYLKHLMDEQDGMERKLRNKYKFYEGMKNIHIENKKISEKF